MKTNLGDNVNARPAWKFINPGTVNIEASKLTTTLMT